MHQGTRHLPAIQAVTTRPRSILRLVVALASLTSGMRPAAAAPRTPGSTEFLAREPTTQTTTYARSSTPPKVSIGIAASSHPALSLQYGTTPNEYYHVTGYYVTGDAGLTADYQRHLVPSFGRMGDVRLSFYSGVGLQASSTEDETSEQFHLRLPLGMQCELRDLRTATFVEAAGRAGPLPQTRLSSALMIGVRARF